MADVSTLLQALPFINLYRGKTFVLKLGGEVVQDPENLARFAQDVTWLNRVGVRTVLIHGGGPQANELSEKLGLKPIFVQGRRVTDEATLEVTKMVFAGKINTDILVMLRRFGARPVGLSGVDAGTVRAHRRAARTMVDPVSGESAEVDFGLVGDIDGVDPSLLRTLLDHDYIPVLSSLAADEEGQTYNINADTVAAEIARALCADRLMVFTNVPGVMRPGPDGSLVVIPALTVKEARDLIADGTISKGMAPKVMAAVRAVEMGVRQATILSGLAPHALLEETFTNQGSGTLLAAAPPQSTP